MKPAGLSLLLAASLIAGTMVAPVKSSASEVMFAKESSNAEVWQKIVAETGSVTDIKEYENNELLVVYKNKRVKAEELPKSAREEELTESCSFIELDTKKELRQAIASLEDDENVRYVQPNYVYRTLYTNDTHSSSQWQYYGDYNIGMEAAWEKGNGANEEVVVAVIDVGVDYNHEDLSGAMWINEDEIPDDGKDNDKNGYEDDIYGYNFFDDDGIICDYVYSKDDRQYVEDHGTHVAGVIAARADNGVGIAGIASRNNVKIMSLKALGDGQNGFGITGNSKTLINAIQYAEDNGASICNMSLGYTSFDKALYQVMKESKMLFICASGNGIRSTDWNGWDVDEEPEYPAAFDLDNIISVANMNETGMIDASSCYGSVSVDIAAPGTEILSTVVAAPSTVYRSEKYLSYTGTSMAAPMVAGTAALAASYYGNLSNLEIKEAVLGGAASNQNFGNKVAGNRMLNVNGALEYYANRVDLATEITEVSSTSNNKKITVTINSFGNAITKAAYVKGEQTAEYFNGETEHTLLELDGKKVSFEAAETGIYTIYILTENGTETVSCVDVQVPVVKKLKLSDTKKTLQKGKTYKLKATVKPSDMYVKLVYKTSNPKVATVNSKGEITAKNPGTAKITVIAKDGNTTKKAVCKVTVTD